MQRDPDISQGFIRFQLCQRAAFSQVLDNIDNAKFIRCLGQSLSVHAIDFLRLSVSQAH
jgi:hypothetical protein